MARTAHCYRPDLSEVEHQAPYERHIPGSAVLLSLAGKQIGVDGTITPETIAGAEIVYGNLLDEGEMVRHHPEKLAQVLLLCALQPRAALIAKAEHLS